MVVVIGGGAIIVAVIAASVVVVAVVVVVDDGIVVDDDVIVIVVWSISYCMAFFAVFCCQLRWWINYELKQCTVKVGTEFLTLVNVLLLLNGLKLSTMQLKLLNCFKGMRQQ